MDKAGEKIDEDDVPVLHVDTPILVQFPIPHVSLEQLISEHRARKKP